MNKINIQFYKTKYGEFILGSFGLIIPCHRIIGSNGELVGYGGGLPLKKRLLKLEQTALIPDLTNLNLQFKESNG